MGSRIHETVTRSGEITSADRSAAAEELTFLNPCVVPVNTGRKAVRLLVSARVPGSRRRVLQINEIVNRFGEITSPDLPTSGEGLTILDPCPVPIKTGREARPTPPLRSGGTQFTVNGFTD